MSTIILKRSLAFIQIKTKKTQLAFGCQCVAFDEKRNINCQKKKRKWPENVFKYF